METQKLVLFVKKNFGDKNAKIYCKVRDHCHYAGEYRSVEHSICN